jgi:hypothetical protein
MAAGKTEDDIMPWAETIRVMHLLDEIQVQGGSEFPQDYTSLFKIRVCHIFLQHKMELVNEFKSNPCVDLTTSSVVGLSVILLSPFVLDNIILVSIDSRPSSPTKPR